MIGDAGVEEGRTRRCKAKKEAIKKRAKDGGGRTSVEVQRIDATKGTGGADEGRGNNNINKCENGHGKREAKGWGRKVG